METTLRDGGVQINVPLYPRLRTIKDRQNELQAQITKLRQEAAGVEAENHKLSAKVESYSVAELERTAHERLELKAKFEALDLRARELEFTSQRLGEEYASWLSSFASWLYRKGQLSRELAGAPATGEPIYDAVFERDTPRSRQQIQYELQGVITKLAVFSGDATLLRDLEEK